jgi:hypothetical protein
MQAVLALREQANYQDNSHAQTSHMCASPTDPSSTAGAYSLPTGTRGGSRSRVRDTDGKGDGDAENGMDISQKQQSQQQQSQQQQYIPLSVYDDCGARPGDVYLCVEHCTDCTSHGMSLRHNEHKYLQTSNTVLNLLTQTVCNMKNNFPFIKRVFAFRVKPIAATRLGALEVTVAYKPQQQTKLSTTLRPKKKKWLTKRLYSKLTALT